MTRLFVAMLLAVSVFTNAGAEVLAIHLDEENVAVDFQDGRYSASLSLQLPVPPGLALEVLTDFDHMGDFVPNLASSRIVSHAGNVYRIAQQGKANFGPFSFKFSSERRVELFPDGRLVSQALSGSTKYMRSELHFQAVGSGTKISYRIEMVPDYWVPSSFGVGFMRHELAEQFSALGNEMLRRQKK
ncbi:MAG: SRPBCC family protein [Azonexus sp.]|nr:SRPBCC family protein [Azonexus sp.]